jgi:anti-sigma regulatory factor (Ser/Thr protein kinase)
VNEQTGAEQTISLEFTLESLDFVRAGEASGKVKQYLKKLGFKPELVRRAAIAAYEAEMNVIIHAVRGTMRVEISPNCIVILVEDEGPGISDIEQAMKEGFSTAPEAIRELGFGAGMGLPNIKRCADEMDLRSVPGQGTRLEFVITNEQG